METEPAKRFSIWLSDDQVYFLTNDLVDQFNTPHVRRSENPISVIMDILHFVRCQKDTSDQKTTGARVRKKVAKIEV